MSRLEAANRFQEAGEMEDRPLTSDRSFQSLIEKAPDGIALLGADGTIRYYSPAIKRMLGYEEGEVVGSTVLPFLHPDDQQTAMDLLNTVSQDPGSTVSGEVRARHKDGSWHCLEVMATNHLNDPEVGSIVMNFRDITERRQTEEALNRKWEFYQMLSEQNPDGLLVVDDNARIVFQSTSVQRFAGFQPGELQGRIAFDFVHPDDLAIVTRVLADIMQTPGGHTHVQARFMHADGTWHWTEATATNCLDNLAVEGFIVTLRDITERRTAEEALKESREVLKRSNEDLEQFAYVASHDLQEPLRMVGSYVRLLQKRYTGQLDSDADEFIHYAVDGVNRMRTLIENLLDYSRVGTRGRELKPVECEAILDRVLANLQTVVEDNGAIVTHDPLPKVMADELQLGRVFQNLIGNAIKFRDEDAPQVHVSSENQGNEWVFSVQDNGIGFKQECAERVFGIFQRLHDPEKHSGTGMGLAICKKIVERHGGRIWVKSEAGHGTTFYFTIPMSDGQ